MKENYIIYYLNYKKYKNFIYFREMKKSSTGKISLILTISFFFSLFNYNKSDLLVRSPPELKAQFISM